MFYNPAMALDRDLGVAVLRAWRPELGHALRGWEMLSATGIRALRMVRETGRFAAFDLVESNSLATQVLARNVQEAGLPGVRAQAGDARAAPPAAPYDYVDVDPYGSPLPFLANAVRALGRGGLIAVTATDLMVLAGAQSSVCLRKYGARPLRGWLGPEGGLRILLARLAREARSAGRGVRPVLAYVLGHHVRIYAELVDSRAGSDPKVAEIPGDDPRTPELGGAGPFGPMWIGPLFDASLVARLQVPDSSAQPVALERLLTRFRDELAADVPFAYEPNRLAKRLGLTHPPPLTALLEGLRGRGFPAGRSHLTTSAFRTTAPRAVVDEVARSVARADGVPR